MAAQPPPMAAQPSPMAAQPQQPSLMRQMAATAGGAAVGSAVGHTIGHAITGLFSGESETNKKPPSCSWEVKRFMECTQTHSDLSMCEELNEALRQCKANNQ